MIIKLIFKIITLLKYIAASILVKKKEIQQMIFHENNWL